MRFDWLLREADMIGHMFAWHLGLSVLPVLIALVLALPLGWLAHRTAWIRTVLLGGASLLYTIPSLALFVLLPSFMGTRILDPVNVVVALSVYSLALLVRVVNDGLGAVPAHARDAGIAMGYRPFGRFALIELPLAVPVILAGLRVAMVSNVSMVSVAALIGTPQLGLLFTQGLQTRFLTPIIAGIVLCVLLAVVLDMIILWTRDRLTPWKEKS